MENPFLSLSGKPARMCAEYPNGIFGADLENIGVVKVGHLLDDPPRAQRFMERVGMPVHARETPAVAANTLRQYARRIWPNWERVKETE